MGPRCGSRDKTFRPPRSLRPSSPRGPGGHRGRPPSAHERHPFRHDLPRPSGPPLGGAVPRRMGARTVRREHRVRPSCVLAAPARGAARVVRLASFRARFDRLGRRELRWGRLPAPRRVARVRAGRPAPRPVALPIPCPPHRRGRLPVPARAPSDGRVLERAGRPLRCLELRRQRGRGLSRRGGRLGRGRCVGARLGRCPRPARRLPCRADLHGPRAHLRCVERDSRARDRGGVPLLPRPPVVVGLVAAALANRVFPGEPGYAIPTSFLASTFGVLLGADLLRQPPLYGSGPSGLYTIGGAGVLDLVYLSGLLGFGAAYLGYRATVHGFAPVGPPLPARTPSPMTRLLRAFRSGLDGRLSDSLRESASASRSAAQQARELLGLAPSADDRPWQDLPVPGWIVSDQANLDAAARVGTQDGREGFRSWLTARWLVLIAHDLGARRFASVGARIAAFVIDLALV